MFEGEGDIIAATSSLVFPVFQGRSLENFSGTGSDLHSVDIFREMLDELLLPRLQNAPKALIVPLGNAASSGVRYLVDRQLIEMSRVLEGFPHPSGANGHRLANFEKNKVRMQATISRWFAA